MEQSVAQNPARDVRGKLDDRKLGIVLGGVIATIATLQATNNALPYFGLRDDSCQTMFSGLEWSEGSNNHLFLPQHATGDLWRYYGDIEAEVTPAPRDERTRYLTDFLNAGRRINTEALRSTVRQLCDEGHRVHLRARLLPEGKRPREAADACSDPQFSSPHRAIPVRLYETDMP